MQRHQIQWRLGSCGLRVYCNKEYYQETWTISYDTRWYFCNHHNWQAFEIYHIYRFKAHSGVWYKFDKYTNIISWIRYTELKYRHGATNGTFYNIFVECVNGDILQEPNNVGVLNESVVRLDTHIPVGEAILIIWYLNISNSR